MKRKIFNFCALGIIGLFVLVTVFNIIIPHLSHCGYEIHFEQSLFDTEIHKVIQHDLLIEVFM